MGSKKKQSLIIVFGLAVMIAAVLGLFTDLRPLAIWGFEPLSLDKVEFSSSSAYFSEPTWILNFAQGGTGMYARGVSSDIDASEITDGERFAQSDLTFTMEGLGQSCDFPAGPIKEEGLYSFKFKSYVPTTLGGLSDTEARVDCGGRGRIFYFGNIKTPGIPAEETAFRYCIYGLSKTSLIREFSAGRYNFQSKFILEKGSEVHSEDIDTTNILNSVTYLGDSARIKWLGNLATGQTCESLNNYLLMLPSQESNIYRVWYGIDKSKYDYYLSKQTEILDKIKLDGITITTMNEFDAKLENELITITRSMDSALGSRETRLSTGQYTAIVGDSSAKITHETQLQIPRFVAYIKAEWIGFTVPVPRPRIISTPSVTMESGMSAVSFDVINSGERGNINLGLYCPAPIVVETQNYDLGFDAGEVSTANFLIDASNLEDTSVVVTCTASASSMEYSDTSSVYVTVKPVQACTPGVFRCIDNRLEKCRPDGSAFDVWDDCAAKDMTCNWETQRCIDKPANCGNGVIDLDEDCNSCPEDVTCGYGQICADPNNDQRYECLDRGCGNGVCELELGEHIPASPTYCPEDCEIEESVWDKFKETIHISKILCGEGLTGIACRASMPLVAGVIGAILAGLYIMQLIPIPQVAMGVGLLAFIVSFSLAEFVLQWGLIGIAGYMIYLILPYLTKKKRRR